MTDLEMLELAAKATGDLIRDDGYGGYLLGPVTGGWKQWNPLTDDGDALRLAISLRLQIQVNEASILVSWNWSEFESSDTIYEYPEMEQDKDYNVKHINHDKATRRAITRAASEIGRRIK